MVPVNRLWIALKPVSNGEPCASAATGTTRSREIRAVLIVREGELVSVLSKPGQGYLSFVVDLPQMLGELVNVADATRSFAHAIASPTASSPRRKKHPRSVTIVKQRKATRN